MNLNKSVKFFGNPAFGLTPFLFLAILGGFLPYRIALSLSIVVAVAAALFFWNWLRKTGSFNFMFLVATFSLLLYAMCRLFPAEEELRRFASVFLDTLFFVVLALLYSVRRTLSRYLIRRVRGSVAINLKKNLYEFFFFTGVICLTLFPYLVLCFVYIFAFREWHTPAMHALFFEKIRFVLILSVMGYEYMRSYLLNRKLQQEDWLPIIDEKGRVIGRIARSVSKEYGNKILHPRIRIYLFSEGKLYLEQERNELSEGKSIYDTPLNKDLFFKEDFTDCIDAMLRKKGLRYKVAPRFIYRHFYENERMKRMVFMYKLTIKKGDPVMSKLNLKGKFWTEQEIELNKGKGVFSALFEQEVELLQSMIFPVERLISK